MATLNKNLLSWFNSWASKSKEPVVKVIEKSNSWFYAAESVKQQCALNKNLWDLLASINTWLDCSEVVWCFTAWNGISISPTGTISLATPDLNVTSASLAWGILTIIDQDWSVYNINLLSAQANNLLSVGSDWSLYLDCADVVVCIEWVPSLTLNNVITDDLTVTWTFWLPAWALDIDTTWNTLSVTIGWQTDTDNIVDTVVISSDANEDLIVTVNGVDSAPFDISTLIDTEETLTSLVYSEPNTTDGWLEYTDEDWVVNFIKLSHTEVITPVVDIPYTVTHLLNSTRIQVVAYDVLTWMVVDVQVWGRTANSVEITSTTTDDLEIVILK